MIAKIINPKQAEELGLTKRGNKIIGRCVTMTGNSKDDPGRIIEEQIIRENGEKEIVFMAEERKAYFKKQGDYEEYMKQFCKTEGAK